MFSKIKERVLYFAEKQEGNKQKFFRKVGGTYGNFTGKNKERPLNSNYISNILVNYPNLNPTWLLTGKGDMLMKPEAHEEEAARQGDHDVTLHPVYQELKEQLQIKDRQIERRDDQFEEHINIIKRKDDQSEEHINIIKRRDDQSEEYINIIKRRDDQSEEYMNIIKRRDGQLEEHTNIIHEHIHIIKRRDHQFEEHISLIKRRDDQFEGQLKTKDQQIERKDEQLSILIDKVK